MGAAGLVEQQLSVGQESQIVLKGLSDYHSNEIAVEVARREARGQS